MVPTLSVHSTSMRGTCAEASATRAQIASSGTAANVWNFFAERGRQVDLMVLFLSQDLANLFRNGVLSQRLALRNPIAVIANRFILIVEIVPKHLLWTDPEEGVFAQSAAFSRVRVQRVFEEAVVGSDDAPAHVLAEAIGRLLYLVHLAVLLWWLLDKSPRQRATTALVLLTRQILPSTALALRLPPVRRFVTSADELVRGALFAEESVER